MRLIAAIGLTPAICLNFSSNHPTMLSAASEARPATAAPVTISIVCDNFKDHYAHTDHRAGASKAAGQFNSFKYGNASVTRKEKVIGHTILGQGVGRFFVLVEEPCSNQSTVSMCAWSLMTFSTLCWPIMDCMRDHSPSQPQAA